MQHWKNLHDSRDGHLQTIWIALYVSTRTSTTLGFKEQGNGDAQAYWAWPCDALNSVAWKDTKICVLIFAHGTNASNMLATNCFC